MIDSPPNRLYHPLKYFLLFLLGTPILFGALVGAWEAITYVYFYLSSGLEYEVAVNSFVGYWEQTSDVLATPRQYFFAMLLGFILGLGAFFVVLFLQKKV